MAIGLEAVFKMDQFAQGLDQYLKAVGVGEQRTEAGAGAMNRAWTGMAKVGGVAVAATAAAVTTAAAGLIGFVTTSIPYASDLSETVSKIGVVFGDTAPEVLAWGKTAARAMGMSQNAALAAAGTYGNLFRAMGITEDASRDMSMGLVQLASDLASFNNMDPTEVLEKLRAGLSGETEPLKSLGVNLSAAAVEARALEMGLARSADELTPAAKAQATYALILEQTTLAQGDFARTSEGLANQQRITAALFDDLRAAAGRFGLAISTKLASQANKALEKVTRRVGIMVEAFEEGGVERLFATFEDGSSYIGGFLNDLGVAKETAYAFGSAINTVARVVMDVVPRIFSAIGTIVNFLVTNRPVLIGIFAALTAAIAAWAYTTIAAAVPAVTAWVTAMGPAIVAILAIGAAVGALYWAWENNFLGMRDTLTAFWETTVQPALAELWTWLQVNIPKAIEVLKTYWETVLLPAIKTVVSWIAAKLVPILKDVFEWLKVNLPKAIDVLEKFWTDVLLPAIEAVWAWMQDTLFPLFEDLWEWLQKTIPAAIETLKRFWENTLLPAIKSVWSWIQNTLFPLFDQLWAWLQNTIPQAIQTLKGYWENTLLPAIKAVWAWMDTVLFPFLETLVDFLDSVFGAALRTLAGVWKEKLLPAIKDVAGWVEDHVLPAFKKFTDWLTKTFKPVVEGAGRALRNAFSAAFDWVTRRIKELTDKLQWLIDLLDKIGGGDDGGGGGGTPKPPPTCFAAGTPVATPEGDRPIEAIQPGDAVLVLEESGRLVAAEVAETIRDHHDQVVTVALSDGQRLTCSLNHRFRTLAGAWVWARDLAPGTQLTPIYAEQAWVTAVEPRAGAIDVYNLHVGHTEHTYIAGGVVVHNAKPDESSAGLTGSLSAASSAATPSATVANIVNNFSLGGNTIVSPMDAAVFEARVEAAVQRALSVV